MKAMSIYSTVNITRDDAIELIRSKINDPDFLANVNAGWLENILFSITDNDDNESESRYFNYSVVEDYIYSRRYYLDADETMTNMYLDNKHLF